MDFQQITTELAQDEEGVTVPIDNKVGEPYLAKDGSPSTITLVGGDSKRVQRARDAQTRRLLRARRQKLEPQDLRDNRIELVVAAVTGWHGWEQGGADWPCTPENVKELMTVPHILAQCEEAMDAGRSFLAKSSTDS